jgi:hypothetical protein
MPLITYTKFCDRARKLLGPKCYYLSILLWTEGPIIIPTKVVLSSRLYVGLWQYTLLKPKLYFTMLIKILYKVKYEAMVAPKPAAQKVIYTENKE